MTVQDYLLVTVPKLEADGIQTARLDCLVLLEDITTKSKSHLLAHQEIKLTNSQLIQLARMINIRAMHTPLAYIRSKAEFYGREFNINEHVLVPRPESETMIDLLKKHIQKSTFKKSQKAPLLEVRPLTESGNANLVIVDVGTGSGALGITAGLEIAGAEIIMLDIDNECLKIAGRNAKKLGLHIKTYQGDLVEPLLSHYFSPFAVLANLPYVPDDYPINSSAVHEPQKAIFGGADGLDLYHRLFIQLKVLKPQYVFTEALPFQHQDLTAIAKAAGYDQLSKDDFIQVFTAIA